MKSKLDNRPADDDGGEGRGGGGKIGEACIF